MQLEGLVLSLAQLYLPFARPYGPLLGCQLALIVEGRTICLGLTLLRGLFPMVLPGLVLAWSSVLIDQLRPFVMIWCSGWHF